MAFSLILVFIVTYVLFSISGILFPMDRKWYATVKKPSWIPPWSFIAIVWAILYGIISLAVTIVYHKTDGFTEVTTSWLFFLILNYIFNQSYRFFLFKVKNLYAAFLDCFAVAVTTFLLLLLTESYSKLAAWLFLPYLLWACFATFLAWIMYNLNKK